MSSHLSRRTGCRPSPSSRSAPPGRPALATRFAPPGHSAPFALLLLLLPLILHSSPAGAATPFVSEIADTGLGSYGAGLYESLKIDSRGNPHISYYNSGIGYLMYASKSAGSWAVEIADLGGSDYVGQYTSLALDSLGAPHIAYYDSSRTYLKYASKVGPSWVIEKVDSGGNVGKYASLALDPRGNPHIAYWDQTNDRLKYASKANGAWVPETAMNISSGQYTSLAFDAQGVPEIATVTSANALYQAIRGFFGWSYVLIDGTNSVTYTSIAFNAQGAGGIAYQDQTHNYLRFFSLPGFFVEVADSFAASASKNVSLAMDSQGVPHACYGNNEVHYASRAGGAWSHEKVVWTNALAYGASTSMALDPQGNPAFSYYDQNFHVLRYADSGVHVLAPAAAANWPVGSRRNITWSGLGPVDVLLSTDGGISFQTLRTGIVISPIEIRVPHAPGRFAQIEVRRASPFSVAFSESLFTIQTNIALLGLKAQPLPGGGNVVSWSTDPGPADLAGYRLFRASAGGGDFGPVTSDVFTATSFTDAGAPAVCRYRLDAVNGWGEEMVLGETSAVGRRLEHPIESSSNPYRGGRLAISYAVPLVPVGSGATRVEVSILDVGGRRMRVLQDAALPGGSVQQIEWDGRAADGADVSSGIYYVRVAASRAGYTAAAKIVVVR